jgi:hypothetical protein
MLFKMVMKRVFIVLCSLYLFGCRSDSPKNEASAMADSVALVGDTLLGTDVESMPNEYQTYYIVVADTSKNYFGLQKMMYTLEDKVFFEIDTMNRYYNAKKDLICLPDNDEDEIYAGDYFPRRSPSPTLSLEYLNFYKPEAGEKAIALVAGIYEGEGEANVRLADVLKFYKSAFVIKSDVFVGCMH